MMNLRNVVGSAVLVAAVCGGCGSATAQEQFPWQKSYAQVVETGDLKWTPQPYQYRAGKVTRYIDFEAGNDASAGTKEQPWKHHPWDPKAQGNAKAASGVDTYVFKGGVVYRGVLRPDAAGGAKGTSELPIQLTYDPTWGNGPAQIWGSQKVGGFKKASHPKMQQKRNLWAADIDFLTRAVWMIGADGKATRLQLAREPNWKESDEQDVMSEWYIWENPEWWKGDGHQMQVDGKAKHLGIDRKHLTGTAEDYVGGTVWSEWGIVMGSPYPALIEGFDAQQKGVGFRGPWTYDPLEKIIRNNRYFLENKPQWLDEPGEFWVEKKGNGGTLYVWLPDNQDPNAVTIEAGREINILDAKELQHVHVRGLDFRFTTVHWEYAVPQWAHPDVKAGVIRTGGNVDGLVVENCTFEHVHQPLRVSVAGEAQIGTVRIADCVMRETDNGAIEIDVNGRLRGNVELLRNNLYRIGWRALSGGHGHAITVNRPETALVAGNFLHRIAGWGIAVSGGSGETPFVRYVVKENRIEDPLLKSNDWGGIETWQGGPHYVYNNVSINPGGLMHWVWKPEDKNAKGTPRFGHAYYLDGSFKNYLFNNIAIGRNNEINSKYANEAGLQGIIGFQNMFVNNTFYKFVQVSRQQAPEAGRAKYLGNIFDDTSEWVFRHADEKAKDDANAAHFQQGDTFAYETMAYANNVLHDVKGKVGLFEADSTEYQTLESMREALKKRGALASDIGVVSDKPVLASPGQGDFRPAASSPAVNTGVKAFMPWSLYSVVGEWNFTRNNKDANEVTDEHWNMAAFYTGRDMYKNTPRYPLKGTGFAASDYVAGPLEDWTNGALRFDGTKQMVLSNAEIIKPFETTVGRERQKKSFSGDAKPTVQMTDNNFLVEAYFRAEPGSTGSLASKMDQSGYELGLNAEGTAQLVLRVGGGPVSVSSGPKLNDGKWHHVIGEVDRKASTLALYVDGRRVALGGGEKPFTESLENSADFVVGKGFKGEIDFLRVARGTLADAKTTIDELYAWQFDGPFLRDFAGKDPVGKRDAGALERR